jgi:predicted ferric reductase
MIIAASVDPGPHLYWLSSRAAGTAALVLASASVFVGALRAGGLAGGDVRGSRRRLELGIIHEGLGLATIVALLIHGFVLLGDNFAKQSFGDIAVPFLGSYHPGPNGIGIICGYLFMVLGLTYYVRDRIGEPRWLMVHRVTLLAWLGSFVHTFGEGTDKHRAWFLAVVFLPAAAALVVLVMRLASGRARQPAPQRTA